MQRPITAEPTDGDALLVNSWHVSDGAQDEFLGLLEELFEYLQGLRGFVEGAVLRGVDPTRFVTYTRMRSRQDRQRAREDAEVSELLRAARRIAISDLHNYEVLHSFRARGG
jgi:heme-degrading monooxygenase HmoA